MENMLFVGIGLVVFLVILVTWLASRYKFCPSDRILVVYGKVGERETTRCMHGGAAFIWPIIQDYAYLDLTPVALELDFKGIINKQKLPIDISSLFYVGISVEPLVMQNASDHLLGLDQERIRQVAKDIITKQFKIVVSSMNLEEISLAKDSFIKKTTTDIDKELKKIGLYLIQIKIDDVKNQSDIIDALKNKNRIEALQNLLRQEQLKSDVEIK